MKKSKDDLMICNICKGIGFLTNEDGRSICKKCFGAGKLDFIENILGKKEPNFFDIDDEIARVMSKKIAEDIDKEILDMFKKDFK